VSATRRAAARDSAPQARRNGGSFERRCLGQGKWKIFFFWRKRSKKTFSESSVTHCPMHYATLTEVLWFFFPGKNRFPGAPRRLHRTGGAWFRLPAAPYLRADRGKGSP
jgi:hypothetical protein